MIVARSRKQENIAEYLLYMWQVEDIIRACHCDTEIIEKNIISGYTNVDTGTLSEIREWYDNLVSMMRNENIVDKGHLQINKNVIIELSDLHQRLLQSTREPFYNATFFKTLPYIVELRSRSGNSAVGELETCFNALYGVILLRLQKKEISEDTLKAVSQISRFLALLSEEYKKDCAGNLEL